MTSQDSYLFESKNKKSGGGFARFCKFLFFVIAFILVIITILANMGGSNDMLRESVERFVSESFGKRPAQIGILHKMSFFPSVGVHTTNIKVFSKPEDDGGYPVVKIGQIEAFMGFWSVVTSEPKFKKLVIEDVSIIKGMLVPEEFSIQHIFVDHVPGEKTATLIGKGKVGTHDWSFTITLDAFKGFAGKSYSFGETMPFILNIADVEIKGKFSKNGKEFFKFDDVVMTNGGKSAEMNIAVYAVSGGLLKVKGSIKDGQDGTEMIPELLVNRTMRPNQVNGDIILNNFNIGNSAEQGNDLTSIISRLRDIAGYTKAKTLFDYMDVIENNKDIDATLKFQNAVVGDQQLSFEMPYMQKNGQRKLGPARLDSASEILFPSIVFTDITKDKKAFIVMGGEFDTKFASAIFSNMSSDISTQPRRTVECGVGIYGSNDDAITLEDAQIILSEGQISAREQKLSDKQKYHDFAFELSNKTSDVEPLDLPDASYDFVKSQLHMASPNPTKCDDLITQISDVKE